MSRGIKAECPKCHSDRTMLESSFGLPGYVDPKNSQESGARVNLNCATPVRLVLCPCCHYIEMYHDVGLGKLV